MTEVIVMTAYGTIESAVEAMRLGAFDYIQKPFTEQELLVKVEQGARQPAPRRRGRAPRERVQGALQVREHRRPLAGRPRGARAHRQASRRPTRRCSSPARAAPARSSSPRRSTPTAERADRPFVPVNCAAITETLLESELFGHARGAFTGAVSARKGLFEEADGGTFFFDEIAETPLAVPGQAPPRDPGERDPPRRREQADPASTCASSPRRTRISCTAIAEKRFRQDLYYRLNVARFMLPPLRERREDIPMLLELLPREVQPEDGHAARASPTACSRRCTQLRLPRQHPRAREHGRAGGRARPAAASSPSTTSLPRDVQPKRAAGRRPHARRRRRRGRAPGHRGRAARVRRQPREAPPRSSASARRRSGGR